MSRLKIQPPLVSAIVQISPPLVVYWALPAVSASPVRPKFSSKNAAILIGCLTSVSRTTCYGLSSLAWTASASAGAGGTSVAAASAGLSVGEGTAVDVHPAISSDTNTIRKIKTLMYFIVPFSSVNIVNPSCYLWLWHPSIRPSFHSGLLGMLEKIVLSAEGVSKGDFFQSGGNLS